MRRHELDVVSLVFGLLFLGLSAMWPLTYFDVLDLPGLQVAAPILLVSVGLAGLVASFGRIRRNRDEPR